MKKSRKNCALDAGRWVSYAAAGAATAMAASNDAEAGIYYSGTLNAPVSAGHEFVMSTLHSHVRGSPPAPGSSTLGNLNASGGFGTDVMHPNSGQHLKVAGRIAGSHNYPYAYKLALGANISAQNFVVQPFGHLGIYIIDQTAPANSSAAWLGTGTGFLGFEFKRGANAEQYGWVRLSTTAGTNNYKVVDYAFGSPGQAITAGQTAVPEPATLGLLALGAAGLLACRVGRRRKAVG